MKQNERAGGKAYESPVAEAILIDIPFDIMLYGDPNQKSTEDPNSEIVDYEW